MALDQLFSSLLGDRDPRKAGLRRGLCMSLAGLVVGWDALTKGTTQ
jgi:hypothetical protein